MTRFHISPDTKEARRCSAQTPASCHYATDENPNPPHFDSMESALEEANRQLREELGAFHSVKKPKIERTVPMNRLPLRRDIARGDFVAHTDRVFDIAERIQESDSTGVEIEATDREDMLDMLNQSRQALATEAFGLRDGYKSKKLESRSDTLRRLQRVEELEAAVRVARASSAVLVGDGKAPAPTIPYVLDREAPVGTLAASSMSDMERMEAAYKADPYGWSRMGVRSSGELTYKLSPKGKRLPPDARVTRAYDTFLRTRDENGDTVYSDPKRVDDVVSVDGEKYFRVGVDSENRVVYPDQPYSFRIQVDRELTEGEAERLAGLVGYQYAKTGGERSNDYVQDSPNSIIFRADTTKGRAYRRVDEFVSDLDSGVKEGSPVRKTDRSGPGTKGTRLVDGLDGVGEVHVYADDAVYGADG